MWNLNKQEFSGKLFLTALCEERRKRADSVENRMKYMGKENETRKLGALWDGKRERKNSVGKERKVLTQEGGCGNISHALSKQCIPDHARVVELVDSLASGASARKGVRVRLPPRAPQSRYNLDILGRTPRVSRGSDFFYCSKSVVCSIDIFQ